jgi:hypothetical protein
MSVLPADAPERAELEAQGRTGAWVSVGHALALQCLTFHMEMVSVSVLAKRPT